MIDNNARVKWAELPAPELTDSIFSFGTVLVYVRLDEVPVLHLPYTSNHPEFGPYTLNFLLDRVGYIVITQFTHDNSGNVGIGTQLEFRYVLIPGGITQELATRLADYRTAKAYLQLPD